MTCRSCCAQRPSLRNSPRCHSGLCCAPQPIQHRLPLLFAWQHSSRIFQRQHPAHCFRPQLRSLPSRSAVKSRAVAAHNRQQTRCNESAGAAVIGTTQHRAAQQRTKRWRAGRKSSADASQRRARQAADSQPIRRRDRSCIQQKAKLTTRTGSAFGSTAPRVSSSQYSSKRFTP